MDQRHPDHEDCGHPSEDTSDRFPDDAFLRRHGFKIHGRPKAGGATWRRDGQLYDQVEAVALARLNRPKA